MPDPTKGSTSELVFVGRGIAFLGVSAFFSTLAMFSTPFGPRALSAVARAWGRAIVSVTGVRVVVEGSSPEQLGPCLFMATHTSHFDTPCLYSALPGPVRFVAKKELVYVPLFGWALALGAAIIIDRRNRAAAIRSIERAKATLRRGVSVLVFPEGTRTPEGSVGPLKKGPFHLAVGADANIVPVAVLGTGQVLPAHSWRISPSTVTLRFGTPIQATAFGTDEQGRSRLMESVSAALRDLSEPVLLDRSNGPS